MSIARRVDPRLSRQIAAAGDDALVQAILIVGGDDDPASQPNDAGRAARVIAQASARAGQAPERVAYLPRANAVILAAPVSYLHVVLGDQRVILASATTIDIFPWE
jgi:hypothetical protein